MDDTTLQNLCEQISQRFPVTAIPAQIINDRRWEFIGDAGQTNLPISPPFRIKISDSWGVVMYDWQTLSPEQQEMVQEMCNYKNRI